MERHLTTVEPVSPIKGDIYYREFPPPFIMKGYDIPFGRLEGTLRYNGMELYTSHADIPEFEWSRPAAMLKARSEIEYNIAVWCRRNKERL